MGRHCDRDRLITGSRGAAPVANAFEIKEVGYCDSICPLPTIDENAMFYLKMNKHYKANILPFSGGYLEQPSKFIQAVELIESIR